MVIEFVGVEQPLDTAKVDKRSGIYMIYCTENHRSYVGSAHNLAKRLYEHRHSLKANNHHNQHLQRIFDKYGIEKITFTVLELVENHDDLLAREQEWINSIGVVNICKNARSTVGVSPSEETRKLLREITLGLKRTDEAKERMRVATSTQWENMSEERKKERIDKMKATKAAKTEAEMAITKAKISAAMKGRPAPFKGKVHSEETKVKMSEARKGRVLTEEDKQKIKDGFANISPEKKAEIREKLSKAQQRRRERELQNQGA